MSDGYRTYIMGTAAFDPDMAEVLHEVTYRWRRTRWLATWRVLHVDGFEASSEPAWAQMCPLPVRTGHTFRMYAFTRTGDGQPNQ